MLSDEKHCAGETGVNLVLASQVLQLDRQTDRHLSLLVRVRGVNERMSPKEALGASQLKGMSTAPSVP